MRDRFEEKEAKHGKTWKRASKRIMTIRIVKMFDLWDENNKELEKKRLLDLANQAMLLYMRLEAEDT